jgi:acetyl-CoA carboxylase biotin carboxyl carrier protein
MDIETVRNLIQLMVDNDLAELEVQDGETRVALKRQGEPPAAQDVAVLAAEAIANRQPEAQTPAAQPPQEDSPAAEEDEGLIIIKSPMVGTFYAADDPESPPFVDVGREIQPGTVMCIIEAMKVYNEIKAEMSGVIEKVLVRNEEPVEFGQPLFAVRPAL